MWLALHFLTTSNGFSPMLSLLSQGSSHILRSWNGRAILIASDVEQRQNKIQHILSKVHHTSSYLGQESNGNDSTMDSAFRMLNATQFLQDSYGKPCWSHAATDSPGGVFILHSKRAFKFGLRSILFHIVPGRIMASLLVGKANDEDTAASSLLTINVHNEGLSAEQVKSFARWLAPYLRLAVAEPGRHCVVAAGDINQIEFHPVGFSLGKGEKVDLAPSSAHHPRLWQSLLRDLLETKPDGFSHYCQANHTLNSLTNIYISLPS